MSKQRQPRDRSANKPGRTVPNMHGGRTARHVVNPAGSKLARAIARRQGGAK